MKIDLHAHILPQKWPDFEKVCSTIIYRHDLVQVKLIKMYISNSGMVVGYPLNTLVMVKRR